VHRFLRRTSPMLRRQSGEKSLVSPRPQFPVYQRSPKGHRTFAVLDSNVRRGCWQDGLEATSPMVRRESTGHEGCNAWHLGAQTLIPRFVSDPIPAAEAEMIENDLSRSVGDALQLTGAAPCVEAIRRSVEAVAPHLRTVIVTGETGTGKEVVARLIHQRSGRQGPFLAVNCGALTEALLASELFGHVRGAFTGAVAEQPGLFRAAHGGTLFLDEAGDIPPALQATLLRVLETRQVRPVGSTRDVPVDVRVVSASNRELVTLVRQGQFRADLYARLAQWVIRLPPLRDRRDDIPALSRALLAQFGAAERTLTPELEEALLGHPWPLNVRGRQDCHSNWASRCRRRWRTTASSAVWLLQTSSQPYSTGRAWRTSSDDSGAVYPRWRVMSACHGPGCTGCSGRKAWIQPRSGRGRQGIR
jgi:transcriptional regulator with GAF, ATPase, and Fis domain